MSTKTRHYRAYRERHTGDAVPLQHPTRKGALTFVEAVSFARRVKGCTTVGVISHGEIVTVWAKPTCPSSVRRERGLSGRGNRKVRRRRG